MSDLADILKDTHSIWQRLFDHKGFLNGEIQYALREYEQKRNDQEVENLFAIVENIADIKDTQIDKSKQLIDSTFPQIQLDLVRADHMLKSIEELEQKHKENNTLEQRREKRKAEWRKFVEEITEHCSEIDESFIEKEDELQEFYRDLERKLHLTKIP